MDTTPIRFLHFADLHIDHGTTGARDSETGLPARVVDIANLLKTVIDYAITNSVNFVVFSGDAYHTHKPHQEYKSIVHRELLRLTQEGIPIYIVVGNHDKIKRSTSRDALHEFKSLDIAGVHVFDEPGIIRGEGYQIAGIPWQYGEFDVQSLSKEMSGTDFRVAVAHATVPGALYQSGEEATSEVELGRDFIIHREEFYGFDYVALGHIHRPQVLFEDPPIIYPGSVGYHTWGEAGDDPHGFIDVTMSKDGVYYTLIPYEDRKRYDIGIWAEEISDVEKQLPEADPEGMYRVTVHWSGEGTSAKGVVEHRLGGSFSLKVREKYPNRSARDTRIGVDEDLSMREILNIYLESIGEELTPELEVLWDEVVAEAEAES